MKTLIFSAILCFFTLQISVFPQSPCNKAIEGPNTKDIFRPKKIIAPAIDEEAIVLNLPQPRCGGFMKRDVYYRTKMFIHISNFPLFTQSFFNHL